MTSGIDYPVLQLNCDLQGVSQFEAPLQHPVVGDGISGIAYNTNAISILSYLFSDSSILTSLDTADVIDDGRLDVSDPIALLSYLFSDAHTPAAPFRLPGFELTDESLGCEGP